MNLYDLVLQQYQESLTSFDLDNEIKEYLTFPKNEIIVNYPVRLDNNSIKMIKAYRVQHNNILGPFKGGTVVVNFLITYHIQTFLLFD